MGRWWKLHGLGPKKPITGGGTMEDDGWSSPHDVEARGAGAESYLYAQKISPAPGAGAFIQNSQSLKRIPGTR